MAALHLAYVPYASDSNQQVAFSSGKGIQARIVPTASTQRTAADNPRLPQFKLKGAKGSTAFLNAVFWLVFDSISTWRSMLQLYCNAADMANLARPIPCSTRFLRRWDRFVLHSQRCQRFQELGRLHCMLVTASYAIGAGDRRANLYDMVWDRICMI